MVDTIPGYRADGKMTNATKEEKERIISLIKEFRDTVAILPELNKKPMGERLKIANRLDEMKQEIVRFRKEHPND